MKDYQIKNSETEKGKIDETTKAALVMLIKVLRIKKNYILTSNNLSIAKLISDKSFSDASLKQAKNISLTFESY